MEKMLNELKDLSISLSRNNEHIDIYDPEENLTDEIIAKIRQSKKDLLTYLKKLEAYSDFESITPAAESDHYPLSPAQKRLYFLYELNKNSLAYSMSQVYKVKGNLSTANVGKVFKKIIARHESLRTNFVLKDGAPVQVIRSSLDFEVMFVEAMEEEIDGILNDFIAPFDLGKDCLVRVCLIQLRAEDYILALDMPHIIGDGISGEILVGEFRALYLGETLSPLPLQFKDYVVWQLDVEQKEAMNIDKKFWLNTFDATNILELPIDYQRPKIKMVGGDIVTFELDEIETRSLKEIALENDTTLFAAIFTIYNILCYKLTNQKDIVIGIPTVGRDHPDLEDIVGMFVNTLPIRNILEEDSSFTKTLAQVSKTTLECFDHQSYPYDELVEALKLKRSPNRTPLFDISFTYNNFDSPKADIDGLEFEVYNKKIASSKLDLSLTAAETSTTLELLFEYDTNLFHKTTIKRFKKYFKTIVNQVIRNKHIQLSQIDILTEEEQNIILKEFNKVNEGFPVKESLLDLFTQQMRSSPTEIAVQFEKKTNSYKELEVYSNRFANYLCSIGIKKGQHIPICLEQSIEMVWTILGVLKSGAVYVPIDPHLPKNRKEYMLKVVGADILITKYVLAESLLPNCTNISLDDFLSKFNEYSSTAPDIQITSDDLCYVMFTSGTSGNPKGVMITHGGVTNLVVNQIDLFGLTPADRVLQFASFSFDAFVSEMFTTLNAGATLIIAPKEAINSKDGINRIIKDEEITCVTLPPSYQSFLNAEANKLRLVISAGEAFKKQFASTFNKLGIQVINAYGPTENTVCTTIAVNPIRHGRVVIGKPLKGIKVYILDNNNKLCVIGRPGELCVAGAQVAQGYINGEKLTSDAFVKNPYPEKGFERLYRTGDLARWTSEGNIEFLGRADKQVKIRGYRIELDEVQNALQNIPFVADNVVLPSEDNLSLHAYFKKKKVVELWPSIAEFLIYDDLVYSSMYNHLSRNEKYKSALKKVIAGKVVLEIGPGPEAILSRLCIECGAKKVYSVEILEETYWKAKKRVKKENLTDKIKVIHGDIMKLKIPEDIDFCVSEIVGSIGGSEGAAVLIDYVKKSMKYPENMIPSRSTTKIAAITMDESMFEYGFSEVAHKYVKKIFDTYGENFEFRICLKNLPKKNIISDHGVFEDLDYTSDLKIEYTHMVKLNFLGKSTFNGLYVWMDLHLDNTVHLDILEDSGSWLPIFFPVAYPGYEVQKNDYLDLEISRSLSSNDVNPDYFIKGVLHRQGQKAIDFRYTSYHHQKMHSSNAFYSILFERGIEVPLPTSDATTLRKLLADILPNYMIPTKFKALDEIPLTANGKIDKKTLEQYGDILTGNFKTTRNGKNGSNEILKKPSEIVPNSLEERLIRIWAELLHLDENSIHRESDFFELGGHSLLAIELTSAIKQIFSKEIPLAEIFETSTIKGLSQKLETQSIFPIEGAQGLFLMKQAYSEENNLFVIHDGSGHINAYVEMVKGILGYNCYGIKYDLPDYGPQNTSVEELASEYIKKMKVVQEKGPYNLVGWSLGGVVLYEIARQLQMAEEGAPNIVIIDSKFDLPFRETRLKFNVQEEKKVINSIIGKAVTTDSETTTISSLWSDFVASNAFEKMKRDTVLKLIPEEYYSLRTEHAESSKKEIIKAVNTSRTLNTIIENYRFKGAVDASALYIKASDSKMNLELTSAYFGVLEINEITGDHHAVMSPPLVSKISDLATNFLILHQLSPSS